jgi:hypothetical protein
MLAEVMRRLLWRRRVRAVHAWRDEQRAEYFAAIARTVEQGRTVPDPAGQRTGRAA